MNSIRRNRKKDTYKSSTPKCWCRPCDSLPPASVTLPRSTSVATAAISRRSQLCSTYSRRTEARMAGLVMADVNQSLAAALNGRHLCR